MTETQELTFEQARAAGPAAWGEWIKANPDREPMTGELLTADDWRQWFEQDIEDLTRAIGEYLVNAIYQNGGKLKGSKYVKWNAETAYMLASVRAYLVGENDTDCDLARAVFVEWLDGRHEQGTRPSVYGGVDFSQLHCRQLDLLERWESCMTRLTIESVI